jgi:aldose 1-epimerase
MGKITKSLFGTHAGKDVYRFTMQNDKGNSISVISYGATVISWMVGERDIVAGFDKLSDYLGNDAYFGCIAGRVANRIAGGKFSINGDTYTLAVNNGPNHLHGGNKGFDKVIWEFLPVEQEEQVLSLHYLSRDGEEGYPGNLKVRVDYAYTNDDELIIGYFAETDKPTPVNLTSHCYFNLTGDMDISVLGHLLVINADRYTPVDENQLPTGEMRSVSKTAFDFREPVVPVEEDGGYDHNFVLNKNGNPFSFAAALLSPGVDLELSVFTTEPGLQLYTGNSLDGRMINRDGKPINKHSALCLETQHFPDSPNQPGFPSCILMPGESYFSKTVYKISGKEEAAREKG